MKPPNSLETAGTALVASGPSGTGKTTVCRQLLAARPDLHFSVSCTTRAPRAGEVDGRDYYFLTQAEFDERRQQGEFLEYANVHGYWYGTLRAEAEKVVLAGRDVLLDIDVQGALQVRERIRDTVLETCTAFVFIGPPDLLELERRLRGRGTDTEDVIQRRLTNARAELAAWQRYDYLVINDDVDAAVDRLQAILLASRCRTNRLHQPPWGRAETE